MVAKLDAAGAVDVLVTERGVSFGYNTLVSDMRALPILARETGAPVIFDATHSVQQPGGQGSASGGERAFVPVLARAAVAVGVAGVFIETHQDPGPRAFRRPQYGAAEGVRGAHRRVAGFRPARQALNYAPMAEACHMAVAWAGYFRAIGREDEFEWTNISSATQPRAIPRSSGD